MACWKADRALEARYHRLVHTSAKCSRKCSRSIPRINAPRSHGRSNASWRDLICRGGLCFFCRGAILLTACRAVPAFNSPCRRSQTDAALVSRPKEQATRPRVLLLVKSADLTSPWLCLLCPCQPTRRQVLGWSIRATSSRPDSGNALSLHLWDRHQTGGGGSAVTRHLSRRNVFRPA